MKRSTAGLVALVTIFAAVGTGSDASADEIYPMVFPVAGENSYSDDFGDPRSGGRTHNGIDIMADKMTPVVAVADGTVGWMHDEQGDNCCAMALNHDDGWESWYIHLNNDTPGTDDGLGWGFADGIEPGVHVVAGQLLGWVGDSGNAESTAPHLHFELHRPDDSVVNPYESLLSATDPLANSPIERLAGLDRYRTAIAISQAAFPNETNTVFVATGENYPDSLAGVPPATRLNAPILLTHTSVLNTYTKAELSRLSPDEIVILGGPGAVSESVESELTAYASTVSRLAGPTRFETAAAMTSTTFGEGVSVLYMVNGMDFPEAVISGPIAAQRDGPLLLTRPDEIPTAVHDEIVRMSPAEIVVVARDTTISSSILDELDDLAPTTTIDGSDVYHVTAAVSERSVPSPAPVVYIAVGNDYPDALTGGVIAAFENGPILLVETDSIPDPIRHELTRLAPARIVILGGTGVVSTSVELELVGFLAESD